MIHEDILEVNWANKCCDFETGNEDLNEEINEGTKRELVKKGGYMKAHYWKLLTWKPIIHSE